jgi:hypothetical protein
MKASTRRSFVEAATEFKKIRSEALASYPAAKRGRDRLELLAYLHALASEFRFTLAALRELKLGEPPTPTPPWLTPDAAMAQVRERRRQLLDVEQTVAGAPADDEEMARERARLEHAPRPGCELVAACQDMAWFQDRYLLAETFAEAADASALPVEEHEEFVDEAARAKMMEARQNRTLARMKDFAAGGGGDLTEIQRSTKAVERARKDIDTLLADAAAEYKTTAEAGVRILAENYPGVFANDQEPGRILSSAGDLDDPENRQRMKQWLTTKIVLNTAEAWAQEIRQSLFGDEGAESSSSKADSTTTVRHDGAKGKPTWPTNAALLHKR